ncbi:hypothetical protein LCGC14_1108430 [marine sediment metagenome]|uniref:GTP-binding protein n=1 Tax=marine sediment metagenome TaxID=412755 RepID=A0A0F9PQN5_9ZZZZ
MLKYKIVLAGAKNVGKSSLIARYCDNIFYEKTKETIGVAFKRKEVIIKDNLIVELNIWDFGGEKKFRILFPAYVNGAAAALLLYDTTNKKSLEDIENWVKIIDENSKEIIKVTIATKIDLKTQREISKAEAIQFSEKFNCYGEPIGTSSKTGENIELAFLSIINAIVEKEMQLCDKCNEYFSKKLKICNYCGCKAESNAI